MTDVGRVAPGDARPAGRVRRLAVAALAGLALHLAFPRPGWDLLAWVALAPVLALALTAPTPRRAFLESWVAGLAFFLPLLRWLTHTMATFSALTLPLAVLVLLALAAYLALYWGGVAWALAWLRARLGPRTLWLAPALWVAAELRRTHLIGGFPWGRPRLRPVAAPPRDPDRGVGRGVRGVRPRGAGEHGPRLRARRAAMARGRGRGPARGRGRRRRSAGGPRAARAIEASGGGPTLPVALVQGNIAQAVKWDAAFRAETFRIYEELTRAAAPGSRLVVWPEAAVPAYLRFEPGAMRWILELGAAVRVPLLVGAPDADGEGRRVSYLNSAFLVDAAGHPESL